MAICEPDKMPSSDINPANALSRIEECTQYAHLQMWKQFNYLYDLLSKFQEVRVKGAGKMLRDDDEFTNAWNSLRASSVDTILKNLEDAQTFDTFKKWLKRLTEIIQDPRALWNILHTEVLASLKVTPEQSQEIAQEFFSPEMLFEYGLDSFLACALCDFSAATTEESIIDIFYATAGFVRACNLPSDYTITTTKYLEFVGNILRNFIKLPDFNAHKFIWLVSVCHDHLKIPDAQFKKISEAVLKYYTESKPTRKASSSYERLDKWCIISMSPHLHDNQMMKKVIDKAFEEVLQDQKTFLHRYIFGSYVTCLWDNHSSLNKISDPLAAWILLLHSTSTRIVDKKELPNSILADFIDSSLTFFLGYYGEVQPTIERAPDLRRDLFAIVEQCQKNYPGTIPDSTKINLWYLLEVAAVSGASDQDIQNMKPKDTSQKNDVWLGLKHNETDFDEYGLALNLLSFKFSNEIDTFPQMVSFIRHHINGTSSSRSESTE